MSPKIAIVDITHLKLSLIPFLSFLVFVLLSMDLPFIQPGTDNSFRITPKKNKTEFHILQVTDLHLGRKSRYQNRIMSDIRKMCDLFEIDLVINTGDLFEHQNMQNLKKIIDLFDKNVNRPWAFAWGNHDCENFVEGDWFRDFDQIENILEKSPKCIYRQTRQFIENYGKDSIFDDPRERQTYNASKREEEGMPNARKFDGFYGGNYKLEIINPITQNTVWDIFIMNSRRDYHIPPKALRWMRDQITTQTPERPALLFYHVPNYEYDVLWNQQKAYGIKGESVGFEKDRGEIHSFLKTIGPIKGCFVGHDHVNDYFGELDGIRYCYGRKTGTLAYGGSYKLKTENFRFGSKFIRQGATLITLHLDEGDLLNQKWDHMSVFPDGSSWRAKKMEDMGTISGFTNEFDPLIKFLCPKSRTNRHTVPKLLISKLIPKRNIQITNEIIVIKVINAIMPFGISQLPDEYYKRINLEINGTVLLDEHHREFLDKIYLKWQNHTYHLSELKNLAGGTLVLGDSFEIVIQNTIPFQSRKKHQIIITINLNLPISIELEKTSE